MQIAYLLAIGLMMSFVFYQPDPNSPATLVLICAFLAVAYFIFRYNRQIKQQMEIGLIPKPTLEAKRRHFWAVTAGLAFGVVTGNAIIIYTLLPDFGLVYTLLFSIPYDLFIAYLVYWLWRKFYHVT